jgi:hypothetical protein
VLLQEERRVHKDDVHLESGDRRGWKVVSDALPGYTRRTGRGERAIEEREFCNAENKQRKREGGEGEGTKESDIERRKERW